MLSLVLSCIALGVSLIALFVGIYVFFELDRIAGGS